MQRIMFKTFIFILVLTLCTVHSKKQVRNKDRHTNTNVSPKLKTKLYNQFALKIMIHIFTKIGFSSDIQYLITTLNKSCRKVKRRIVYMLRKNLMRIKKLQDARKEFFASKGMLRIIRFIFEMLLDCKKFRKDNKEVYHKIKKGIENADKLENSLKLKNSIQVLKEKYLEKGKNIPKKAASKLFKFNSRVMPKIMKRQYRKTIRKINILSKSCKYYKRSCEHKKKYCKRAKKFCEKFQKEIESAKQLFDNKENFNKSESKEN